MHGVCDRPRRCRDPPEAARGGERDPHPFPARLLFSRSCAFFAIPSSRRTTLQRAILIFLENSSTRGIHPPLDSSFNPLNAQRHQYRTRSIGMLLALSPECCPQYSIVSPGTLHDQSSALKPRFSTSPNPNIRHPFVKPVYPDCPDWQHKRCLKPES